MGDLNNRKLVQTLNVDIGEPDLAPLTIEIRFPDWAKDNPEIVERLRKAHEAEVAR